MADSGSRIESRLPDTTDQSNCQAVMVGELVIFWTGAVLGQCPEAS